MSLGDYFKILLGFVILVLICVVLWLWRDKDKAASDLIAAQKTIAADATQHATDNKQHDNDAATINRITAYNIQNDAVRADFVALMSRIDFQYEGMTKQISDLRRNNADVEKYLATPIPVALLCVLDSKLCPLPTRAATAN